MKREDAEPLLAAIEQTLTGSVKQAMWAVDNAKALGFAELEIRERLNGSMARLAKDREKRFEAAKELRRRGYTNVTAAALLGVNKSTIKRDAARASGGANAPSDITKPNGSADQSKGGGANAPSGRKPHIANNSGEDEWYTPKQYIEAARIAMGGIDLDPASSAAANGIVEADKFFSASDNGLSRDWSGRVWMNPPYQQPLISLFCEKLIDHFRGGAVTQACALINNATETKWFQKLGNAASVISFPNGRIKFWHPERQAAPLQGQAIVYLGDRREDFVAAFEPFGLIVSLIR